MTATLMRKTLLVGNPILLGLRSSGSKDCSFIGILGEILFSAKFKQAIHKKLPKICSEFIFKHFSLKAFIDLMKNNFF